MFKNIFGRKFDRHSRYQKGEVKLGQIQSAGIFKKKIVANFFFRTFCAPYRARTGDLMIKSHMLYQLS